MKIFIISETLMAGGAEWFALRLAEALINRGHEVSFFVLRPDMIDERVKGKFKNIKIIALPVWKVRLFANLDRVIKFTGKHNYLVELFCSRFLKKNIEKCCPDVIHSHLIKSDAVGLRANRVRKIRQVATVHGDYIKAIKSNDVVNIRAIASLVPHLDQIVIISDEQERIISARFPEAKSKMRKIYNGYPLEERTYAVKEEGTFCFGLIARGIPEKGWEPAIRAFMQMEQPDVRLILYSESEYINQLKQRYTDPRIIYAGFTDDPLAAIQHMDVGLLPSYYSSESLPTTIIEYLAMKKPVIATNIGEISKMILPASDGPPAGLIINTDDPEAMVQPLFYAMMRMYSDKQLYSGLQASCLQAFEKFSMKKCVDAYLDIYKTHNSKEALACAE